MKNTQIVMVKSFLVAVAALLLLNLPLVADETGDLAVTPATSTSISGGGGSGGPVGTDSVFPDSLPITKAALEAYAYTLVDSMYGSVWAPSISGDYWFYEQYTNRDANPIKMGKIINAQEFKFTVVPDDQLQVNLSLNGFVGKYSSFELFWGRKFFKMIQTEVGYKIPGDAYQIELQASDWIPVNIPGLQSAWMELEDENGNYNYYDFDDSGRLWREAEVLFLGGETLNLSGTLYVVNIFGEKAMYDLTTGDRKPTVNVKLNDIEVSFKGFRAVPNNTFDIMFEPGDKLIRAEYSLPEGEEGVVMIEFPNPSSFFPIYVIDVDALAENPFAEWVNLNAKDGWVKFRVQWNQRIFIRFEYPHTSGPIPVEASVNKG